MPDSDPIDRFQRRCGGVLLVVMLLLLAGLAGQLAYINTALAPRLIALAEEQQLGRTTTPANRGMILDARGRVAAASRLVPDVFVDPALIEDLPALAAELGPRLNRSADELTDLIQSRIESRYVVVASEVDEVTAQAVRDLNDPAVGLVERAVRSYPLGSSMAHVLGVVGRDGKGLEGIELAFDVHVAGTDGQRFTIRDGRRRALWRSGAEETPPMDGGHVVLTIDSEIQRIVESHLASTVAQFEAKSGVALVMSPRTGRILALACAPSFDPNHLELTSAEVRRNRVITDPVEPGSAFKPIVACGALDAGLLSTTELIDCRMGSHRFGARTVRDTSPHGPMDITGILTKSSNIGMAFIAERMGDAVVFETLKRFGFGEATGAMLPGECPGVVHPLREWGSMSKTSISFGYEVTVTPLQLACAFSAIINDGILLQPTVVSALLATDGTVLESFDRPEIVRRVASTDVARFITHKSLVSVVENGSGHRAKGDHYRVLGKSGTAKLVSPTTGRYEPRAYLSTFVGAAPESDPQLVALVMIRRPNPDIGYYGGTVSAAAVGRILEESLAYLEVEPDGEMHLTGL